MMHRIVLIAALTLLACAPASVAQEQAPWRGWGLEASEVIADADLLWSIKFFIDGFEGRKELGACLRHRTVETRMGSYLTPPKYAYEVFEAVLRPIEGADSVSIRDMRCDGHFSGRIHTHPSFCHRSDVDRASFWREGFLYELVACPAGVRWYTRNGETGMLNWPKPR